MLRNGRTVTILRHDPGGTDIYGDPVAGTVVRVDVDGCAVAPRTGSSGELEGRGRQGITEAMTLYLPAGTDLQADDQVEIDGQTYDVDGPPANWSNPYSGKRPGLEVVLRRTEG